MDVREKYHETVRKFCFTMNYHSPRAYQFLRETFNNCLPHPTTIRSWYSNSDLNTKANVINEQCLNILRRKVMEMAQDGKICACSLLLDEIHIRKHFQYSNTEKKLVGYASTGTSNEQGNMKSDVASQALVFMVSAADGSFQLPIAYYFINSMKADEKKNLLKFITETLMDCGVVIINVTFDGLITNLTMCKLFGATLDLYSPSFKPYIIVRDVRIYIFLDACHMIKLVRNNISSNNVLYDDKGDEIRWQYFVDLVNMKDRGFTHTHKMNQAHINWRQKKMKVDLAVQTISGSTASAIEFLMNEDISEFAGAGPTIKFIRTFNCLFDVFNSKNVENENLFKRCLNAENAAQIFNAFETAIPYIKALKLKNDKGKMVLVCKSKIKTGFKGFIRNMIALKSLYQEMVEDKMLLVAIKTYYLQQDPLEILFGKIRALGRFNCNPTCEQFSAAFRKLLGYNTIMYSKLSNCNLTENCPSNPYSNILSVTSRRSTKSFSFDDYMHVSEEDVENLYEKLDEISAKENQCLENLSDSSIATVAKLIEHRITTTKQFNCLLCKRIFDENMDKTNNFVGAKLDGKPCHSTFEICKQADRFLKSELMKESVNFKIILHEIMQCLNFEQLYNSTDFTEHLDHKIYLIRYVTDEYARIKGTHIAKIETFKQHEKALRSKLHKLKHYLGQ